MKVLMFGWEFPPHISGGLGTACFGLTKGLAQYDDLEVLFVVPKSYGDEEPGKMNLIGAENVMMENVSFAENKVLKKMSFIEVNSNLVPYLDPEEYEEYINISEEHKDLLKKTITGKMKFTGGYGTSLLLEIQYYAMIASIIGQQYDFDLIHAHDWLTYPAGMAAKEASGKPLLCHVHATDYDRSGGSVNPDVFKIEQMGLQAADEVITVSNLTRKTVVDNYGIDPGKMQTVYNAMEPVNYDLRKWKKNVDEKIVTFLGRVTMQKGPEYFIEAASKVLQKIDNVRFVMAGSGDMLNKMVDRAAQLNISDKFHFTGFLRGEDVYQMFAISDLYVMPSVSEPFGISPLEALWSNVPVIISHQSGVSEILKHAVKVDFWDIDAMADAIYGILQYPALPQMFRQHGKIEVDNLKWENSARGVREVYDKMVAVE